MKFSITRVFDISKLLATKAGQDLKDLIEYLNQLQDQLLRLVQNGITLDDNLKLQRKTIVYKEGQTSYELFGIPTGKPALVLFNSADSPVDNPIIFNWRYDGQQGKVQIYLKATTKLAQPASVEIVLFYR